MDDRVCETKSAATERINLPKIAGLRFLQGALIGLGAVLPGISGGVLCVVFGVYKTVMELFSHPVRTLRKRYHILIPLILGGSFGFVVVARMLGFLLEKYPDPSVCLFVGLIAGMLPSLFREAGIKGRSKGSFISLAVCFAAILALLWSLQLIQAEIMPNFNWYLFCGFCIALSVIAPGMSFSTLLMPLGLYTPLVTGIGSLNSEILFSHRNRRAADSGTAGESGELSDGELLQYRLSWNHRHRHGGDDCNYPVSKLRTESCRLRCECYLSDRGNHGGFCARPV